MSGFDGNLIPRGAAFPREVGLLLVGHGTREAVGVEEFLTSAAQVAALAGETPVEPCFLEFAQPSIVEGFRRLVERGVRRIVVVPVLLFAAGHARRDIPLAVAAVASEFPHVAVTQAAQLGCHADLLQLSELRYQTALIGAEELAGDATTLVLVGRGSHDPDATAEMHRFAALRGELPQRNKLRIEVGFVAMATPRFTDVLDAAAQTGARRVVIQPHLLFGGVLLERIAQTTAEYAARYPRQQWLAAAHLGPDPLVARTIFSRAAETLSDPLAVE